MKSFSLSLGTKGMRASPALSSRAQFHFPLKSKPKPTQYKYFHKLPRLMLRSAVAGGKCQRQQRCEGKTQLPKPQVLVSVERCLSLGLIPVLGSSRRLSCPAPGCHTRVCTWGQLLGGNLGVGRARCEAGPATLCVSRGHQPPPGHLSLSLVPAVLLPALPAPCPAAPHGPVHQGSVALLLCCGSKAPPLAPAQRPAHGGAQAEHQPRQGCCLLTQVRAMLRSGIWGNALAFVLQMLFIFSAQGSKITLHVVKCEKCWCRVIQIIKRAFRPPAVSILWVSLHIYGYPTIPWPSQKRFIIEPAISASVLGSADCHPKGEAPRPHGLPPQADI